MRTSRQRLEFVEQDVAPGVEFAQARQGGTGFAARVQAQEFVENGMRLPVRLIDAREGTVRGVATHALRVEPDSEATRVDVGRRRRTALPLEERHRGNDPGAVLDAREQPVCTLQGKWTSWDFRFLQGQKELGSVSKKWAGLGKELFTSADNYMLSISDTVAADDSARMLIMAAVMCIDMVLKE